MQLKVWNYGAICLRISISVFGNLYWKSENWNGNSMEKRSIFPVFELFK